MALKGDIPPPPDDEKGHDSDNPDEGESTKKKGGRKPAKMTIAIVVAIALVVPSAFLLFFNSNPDPPTEAILGENLKLPEGESDLAQTIVANDSVTYKFSSDPGQLNLSAGDYISGTTGYGYIRKVVSVEKSGNDVTVHTENASLCEVVKQGVLNISGDLSLNSTFNTSSATISAAHELAEAGLGFNIPISKTFSSGSGTVHAVGSAKGRVGMELFIQFFDNEIYKFRFTITLSATIELSLDAPSSVEIHGANEQILWTGSLAKMIDWVGLLGIAVVPEIEFGIGTDITLKSSETTSISTSFTATMGREFSNNVWTNISSFKYDPTTGGHESKYDADLKCYIVSPRLKLMLMGRIGPYVDFRPYVRLHVDESATTSWEMYLGAESYIGLAVDVIFKEWHLWEFKIYENEWRVVSESPLEGKWNVVSVLVDGEPISNPVAGSWTEINSDGTYESYWAQGNAHEQGTWKDLGNGQLELHTDSSAFGGAAGTMTIQYTLSASSLTYSYSYTDAEGTHTSVTSFTKATT